MPLFEFYEELRKQGATEEEIKKAHKNNEPDRATHHLCRKAEEQSSYANLAKWCLKAYRENLQVSNP